MLRTADAAGVCRVYMTGYTATPIDRFGRARKDIHKAALGGELSVPWEHYRTISELIATLKERGVRIVGVEQKDEAIDYKKLRVTGSTAFIFGNEVRGLSKSLLDQCDTVSSIPMRGTKESLNVSVAAGIFLFRVLNV